MRNSKEINNINDLYLLSGIFGPAEFLAMNQKFFLILKELLDDKLSLRIAEFWNRAEGVLDSNIVDSKFKELLKTKLELSKEVLQSTVRLNTFHTDKRVLRIIENLEQLTLAGVKYYTGSLEELDSDINYLLDNRRYWQNAIKPRKSSNFDSFLKECSELTEAAMDIEACTQILSTNKVVILDNLVLRVKDNKEAFYILNERARSTKMFVLFQRVEEMKTMLSAIEYNKYCNQNNISVIGRRIF